MDDSALNPTWHRLAAVAASTVPALLAGSACTTDEDDSFRVSLVQFDNASTITLTFSEPLAELGAVDPNDFRLSVGSTWMYTYTYEGETVTYAYTSYVDLGQVLDSYGYGNAFAFASISTTMSPQRLTLETATPLGPDICALLDEAREQAEMYEAMYDRQYDLALFLHYASGEVPIESVDGRELGDVGADWVLSGDLESDRDGFGFTMSPQLRVPCP